MNNTWKTKEGKVIKIKEMTDSHLLNTLRMLERNASKSLVLEINEAYSVSASLQGEMASYYAEQDIKRLEETLPTEWLQINCSAYMNLVKEAEKRKLL